MNTSATYKEKDFVHHLCIINVMHAHFHLIKQSPAEWKRMGMRPTMKRDTQSKDAAAPDHVFNIISIFHKTNK